jgi:signal transduction histidine kinase
MGLVNRVVPKGDARAAAEALAAELARFPQACMRNDRLSAYRQFDLDYAGAMQNEFALGLATMADGQMLAAYGLLDHYEMILASHNHYLQSLQIPGQPGALIMGNGGALLDRLAASWNRQSAFANGVAHELRTPITLINGYAQSLQRQGVVSGEPRRQLALIQSEAERMARMVTDLLDLARDDAGRLELQRQALDPEQLLLEAYERLAGHAGGRLRLLPPGDGEELELAEVCGDPHRLQQCLTNLVENALKYAPQGSPIELLATGGSSAVRLHVRDRGPGVPEPERLRIFERFVRGSAAEGCSGSGLGLSVVRLLMERMGGDVEVAEAPGGGADFQLVLPVRSGSRPPSA